MPTSSTLGRATLIAALAVLLPCAARAQSPDVLIVVEDENTTIGADAYERFAETLLGTGAASVDFAPDLSRELASYKVVVLSLYPISAAERPRLMSFVQEGGVLLMIGEWQTYNEHYQPGDDYVAAFNAFLEAQGVGTRFVFESDDWSSSAADFDIFPHSLTRGVERVYGGGIGVIASGSAARC